MNKVKQKLRLPSFFLPLFWAYDFSALDRERDKLLIVINTINYGTWEHWQWVVRHYGREEVKQIIENTPVSEFRPRALKLISLLLGIKNFRYVSRSDKLKNAKDFQRA